MPINSTGSNILQIDTRDDSLAGFDDSLREDQRSRERPSRVPLPPLCPACDGVAGNRGRQKHLGVHTIKTPSYGRTIAHHPSAPISYCRDDFPAIGIPAIRRDHALVLTHCLLAWQTTARALFALTALLVLSTLRALSILYPSISRELCSPPTPVRNNLIARPHWLQVADGYGHE